MSKSEIIEEKRLAALEAEFDELLIICLQHCAGGRWGLFGAYDQFPEVNTMINWPESERLRELAISIRGIRARSGGRNEKCDEFLRLCALNRPNDLGEPKLARAFLKRIMSQAPKGEGQF